MWNWTSSVLLATLVVSGLRFARSDGHYKIPDVGTGRRSQYYVLHSDGTFKYGFDGGDGAFESVKSHTLGERQGQFGYVDPEGRSIRLEYEAGRGGFVARGDHLPKPSPELAHALATVIRSNTPFVDPLANSGSDASYGFGFSSSDHSRNEQSDSDGTVTGSYSYVDENGATRSFHYRAGKGIGFVIEGDGLTQDTPAPSPSFRQSGGSGFSQTSSLGSKRTHTPAKPSRASFRQTQTHQQSNIISKPASPADPSYSFSFNAGDHSRYEKSDGNLNIEGRYSFVADDGKERSVSYVAGSGTGFQAHGDHLPKAPEPEHPVPVAQVRKASWSSTRKQPAAAPRTPSLAYQTPTHSTRTSTSRGASTSFRSSHADRHASSVATHSRPASHLSSSSRFGQANIRSSAAPSGSYSFSYDNSDHSRAESGDDRNSVTGDFSYVSQDDGQRRQINYQAGSGTGFVVEGAHLPTGPIVPGAPFGQPTGRRDRVSSKPFVDPLADSGDASYNFNFESDTYSRNEAADADGNVAGTYSVVEDDGTKITYRFRAGKGVGFETEEISRSQGPRPAPRTAYIGPLASAPGSPLSVPRTSGHSTSFGNTGVSASHGSGHSHFRSSGAPTSQRSGHSKFRSSGASTSHSSGHSKFRSSAGASTSHFSGGSKFRPATARKTPAFRSSSSPGHSTQVDPDFTLHTYEASPDAHKFGYVIKYNR